MQKWWRWFRVSYAHRFCVCCSLLRPPVVHFPYTKQQTVPTSGWFSLWLTPLHVLGVCVLLCFTERLIVERHDPFLMLSVCLLLDAVLC